MSSRHVTVVNPLAQPVVLDAVGHLLGGGEFDSVDTKADGAELGLARLQLVDDPGGDLDDMKAEAKAAILATRAANSSKAKSSGSDSASTGTQAKATAAAATAADPQGS